MRNQLLKQFILSVGLFYLLQADAKARYSKVGKLVRPLRPLSVSQLLPHEYGLRHKRQTDAAYADYDDNADIIPVQDSTPHKHVDDELKERAEEIGKSFEDMWQSMVESMKQCFEGIKNVFTDVSKDIQDNEITKQHHL